MDTLSVNYIILFNAEDFLLLKIGNRHNSLNSAVTAIFDLCFERSYASIFSYHGKTKKSFKALGIFQVMQGILVSN